MLTAGLAIGSLEIVLAISFAAALFTGSLEAFLPQGIGMAIVGMILGGGVVILFNSLPGTISGNQDLPLAIMTVVVAGISASMPGDATARAAFLTVAAAIALTTLLTGLAYLGFGVFHLGKLVRFLPYPVVGGFLASTGWLLASAALGLMVDLPTSAGELAPFLAPSTLWRWLPGVLLGVTMLLLVRRVQHFLVLPLTLLGSTILFFLIAWAAGLSPAALSAGGWLLGPFEEQGLWRPLLPADLAQVHWPAIAAQAGNMATIIFVSLVGLLLNASGIEIAARRDLSLNHELRVAGLANLLSGLAAGMISFHQLSFSALNFRLQSDSRLTGTIAVVLCVLALVTGGAFLGYAPIVISAGLLLFLGLSFLVEWVIDAWFALPRIDYAIVVTILLATIASSFLVAVALGLLLAVMLFVAGYSRVDVVRDELTAAAMHSRVTRPRAQTRLLRQEGERVLIFRLQGFIFFGTADNLLGRIRRRLADDAKPRPAAIILDFQRVTGLDSTTILSFRRMAQVIQVAGASLALTSCPPRVRRQLVQGGLVSEGGTNHCFPTLDEGLAWAEDFLLDRADYSGEEPLPPLQEQWQSILSPGWDLRPLLRQCERLEVEAGQMLMAQGDAADTLYFVESGQLTAQLNRPGQPPVRLQTMGGGHVVGELGFYLNQPRTAEVIADGPTVLYRLTRKQLQKLEVEAPAAATALHRLLAYLLAERVIQLTDMIDALER